MSQRLNTVRNYLQKLGSGKYNQLHKYFIKNAILSSPGKGVFGIPGKPRFNKYFTDLYKYLHNPQMTLYHIYKPIDNTPGLIIAHFNMKIMQRHKIVNRGQIVDIFRFKKGQSKISSLYVMHNRNNFDF